MNKVWFDDAWDDYLYRQAEDKKTLKGDLSGWWSRRIDETNRLVYRLKDGKIEIAQCRGHYN